MAVWKIMADPDTYRSFDTPKLIPGEVLDRAEIFRTGQAVGAAWIPMQMVLYEADGEEKKRMGDFPSFGGIIPLHISARALKILRPIVKDNVEVLDVVTSVGTFYALNIFAWSCLDHSKSKFVRFDDGGIMRVERYAFRSESLEGKHIFRITERIMSEVLVDEVFKQAVEENGLEGLVFYAVPEVGDAG